MHIVLQHSAFPPHAEDETGALLLAFARDLSARGHRVDVLATTGRRVRAGDPVARRLAERHVEGIDGIVFEAPAHGHLDLIDPWPDPASPFRRILHRWASRSSSRWERLTRTMLTTRRPDLLHTHGLAGMTVSVWRAARACGVPIVHGLRDGHLLEHPATRASTWVDRVISPTTFLLDRHRAKGLFRGVPAHVVPDPVGPAIVPMPSRRAPRIPRVLVLGPLTREHGVELALDLFTAWFEDPHSTPLQVAIAGTGPLQGRVRAFCSRWSQRASLHDPADARALRQLLGESDVMLVPAIADVVTHGPFDAALRSALPVIATRTGAHAEWIEDGCEGMLVEPERKALRAALSSYVQDPERRAAHGERAYQRCVRASRRDLAAEFLALYGAHESELAR